MCRKGPRSIVAAFGLAMVATLALPGCNSTGTTVPPPPQAVFVPDAPTPADGSVTLQAGAVNMTAFDVRVSAKGIQDLFGAAFWIQFDTTKVVYAGYDASGSVLSSDGTQVEVLVDAASSPGTIKVGIGRVQDQGGTVRGVEVTGAADVIVIHLLANFAILGVPIEFDTTHSEIRDSTQPPPGRVIPATWAGGSVTVM